jgi:hypothetical protein
LQALGINASEDITAIKQKIIAGFSQIFSFRKNSRGHHIPLVPFGLFNNNVKLNSGLASTEVKTENSDVVIFVKIINKKEILKLFHNFN